MEEKYCPKCKKNKNIEDFSWKNKNIKRQDCCKKCHTEYLKNHYNKNKMYYKTKTKQRQNRIKDDLHNKIFEFLTTHPCVDCGEKDIIVLDFDHLRDKDDSICSMVCHAKSWDIIKKEIDKCEVRCKNCHARKTAKQFNTWIYKRLNNFS